MHKKMMMHVLFLALTISNVAISQKIIRRTNKFVLIEIAPLTGIKIGTQFDVYHSSSKYPDQKIGRIKVIKFQGSKCAGEIISENDKFPITAGDFLKLTESKNEVASNAFNQEDLTSNQHQTQLYKRKSNALERYLSIGAGIVSCGLGYTFNNKANSIFADYKDAKTAEDATRLYNDAVKYDKNTNIALGVGAGLIVLGVIYPLLKSNSTTNPKYSFDIYSNHDKIQVAVRLPFNLH
jgi:hypothetical protein